MVIIATWIWPTLGLFDYFLFKGNLSKSIKAVFMVYRLNYLIFRSVRVIQFYFKVYYSCIIFIKYTRLNYAWMK